MRQLYVLIVQFQNNFIGVGARIFQESLGKLDGLAFRCLRSISFPSDGHSATFKEVSLLSRDWIFPFGWLGLVFNGIKTIEMVLVGWLSMRASIRLFGSRQLIGDLLDLILHPLKKGRVPSARSCEKTHRLFQQYFTVKQNKMQEMTKQNPLLNGLEVSCQLRQEERKNIFNHRQFQFE